MRIHSVIGLRAFALRHGSLRAIKPLLVLSAVALLSLSATACGGAEKSTSVASRASSLGFKGDEDDDEESAESNSNNSGDKDADFDNDAKDKRRGYHDSDDNVVLTYGHAASSAEQKALTDVVTRYYAAAAAGNGASACSMITSTFVQAIPEDYGQSPGPVYLRGKTCAAVMTLLFKHEHKRLAAAPEITQVRVGDKQAYVFLGSQAVPASFVTMEREGGVWKVAGLLAQALP